MKLSKHEVIELLGDDYEIQGGEMVYQCPKCEAEGGDNSKDNLKFNEEKGFLTCFANEEHSKNLRKQITERREASNMVISSTNKLEITGNLIEQANKNLLSNEEKLTLLKEERGLSKETMEACNYGYIEELDVFIEPCFDIEGNITGAKFRAGNLQPLASGTKTWSAKNTKRFLYKVNHPKEAKFAVITEGHMDGMALYQYLYQINEQENYQILTPSNGVATISKLINNIEEKYEKIILCLDNDCAGRQALSKVALKSNKELYRLNIPDSKDFNDWYLKYNDNDNLLTEISVIPLSVVKKLLGNVNKYQLGVSKYIEISSNDDIKISKQIIDYQNRLFEIHTQEKDGVKYLIVKTLSNFSFTYKSKIKEINPNNPNEPEKTSFEIEFKTYDGQIINEIIPSVSRRSSKDFNSEIYKLGNIISVIDDKQLAQITDNSFKEKKLPTKYIFHTPGLIRDKNIWIWENAALLIENEKVYEKKGNYLSVENNLEVKLAENLNHKPKLSFLQEISTNNVAKNLIDVMIKGYSSSIEVFIAVGLALMSVHKILFKQEIGGFPIGYLTGLSHSGKSNILDLIAKLYGFDSSFILSGASTINKIWFNLTRYVNIPVLFDEMLVSNYSKNYFSTLIKSVYECITRERMFSGEKESNQKVNASLFLASNHLPPDEEACLNRLILLELDPQKFNVNEVKTFNELRDKYLSKVLVEVIKQPEDKILGIFKESKSEIQKLNENLNERTANNLAVAYTGIKILHEIAEIDISQAIKNNFISFIGSYHKILLNESPLDKLLNSFALLIHDGKVSPLTDFKIENNSLSFHSSYVYDQFAKRHRQIEGEKPPTYREVMQAAKFDKRVYKGKDQVTKKITLPNGKPCKGLVIDITGMEELLAFDTSDKNKVKALKPPADLDKKFA